MIEDEQAIFYLSDPLCTPNFSLEKNGDSLYLVKEIKDNHSKIITKHPISYKKSITDIIDFLCRTYNYYPQKEEL